MSQAQLLAAGLSPYPGMRNRIINGGMLVTQRTAVGVTMPNAITSVPYGQCDRMLCAVVGSGTISAGGVMQVGIGSSSSTGYAYGIQGGTFTNGQPYFAQKIESLNTKDLSGKTITVSGKLYQDTGSAVAYTARLQKPNTADNFSAWTQIAVSPNISIPSGVFTPFSFTYTLGSSDAVNGLWVEIFTTALISATTKSFYIADFQLELGTIATPFEQTPYGLQLSLCQRYYERKTALNLYSWFGMGFASSATTAETWITYTPKRATPTLEASAPSTFQSLIAGTGAVTAVNASDGAAVDGMRIVFITSGATIGTAGATRAFNSTAAYLAFSAEL